MEQTDLDRQLILVVRYTKTFVKLEQRKTETILKYKKGWRSKVKNRQKQMQKETKYWKQT